MKYAIAVVSALVALPALADTRIEYVDEASDKVQTAISIKNGNVRMDDPEGNGFTLYNHSTGMMTFVDQNEQTYTNLDEEAMDEMSGQMGKAMAEMRKQLEQMPAEQREMVEKMMGGAKDAGKSMFEMDVERTGETMERAGYRCEQVFFSVGSLARSEICVVDPDEIDMPAEDRRALDGMQAQMRAMAEKMSQSIGINFTFDFDSMGGLPVYMKEDEDDSAQVLEQVSHDSLDASLFEVPEGYREESFSMD